MSPWPGRRSSVFPPRDAAIPKDRVRRLRGSRPGGQGLVPGVPEDEPHRRRPPDIVMEGPLVTERVHRPVRVTNTDGEGSLLPHPHSSGGTRCDGGCTGSHSHGAPKRGATKCSPRPTESKTSNAR